MAIRFRCPECGTRLEAPPEDAGLPIECGRCGAQIGVPADLGDEDGPSPDYAPRADLTPENAALAARGITLLQASLGVYILGILSAAGFNAARVAVNGAQQVFNPAQQAGVDWIAVAGAAVGLVITVTAVVLRWVGYARCKPVGREIGSYTVLTLAVVGVIGEGAGSALAVLPSLFGGNPAAVPPVLLGLVYLGGLVNLVGVGLEFCVLFFFHRLLAELFGRGVARRVVVYVISFAVVIALGLFAACGFGMAVGMAFVAAMPAPPPGGGPPPGPPQFNPANLPQWIWVAGAALLGLMVAAGAVLIAQYYLILARSKAGLLAVARAAEPEAKPGEAP